MFKIQAIKLKYLVVNDQFSIKVKTIQKVEGAFDSINY